MANFEIGKGKLGTPNYITSDAELDLGAVPFIYSTTLAATVEQTLVIPANVNLAIFRYSVGTNVFVAESVSAITLPGAAFVQKLGELNRPGKYVVAGNTLRFICDTPAFVQISFYKANPLVS